MYFPNLYILHSHNSSPILFFLVESPLMKTLMDRVWACGMKVTATMVMVQVFLAGVTLFYKLATNDGMDPRILLAYRFLIATAFLAPLALVLERKKRPKLTWTIIGQSILCGLFGGTLSQNLALEGLVLTSVTFSSAMSNLIPAVTYILALFFGMEKLVLRKMSGKAKLIGTLVAIGGAMILTFYKGTEIKLWSTNIHLLKQIQSNTISSHPSHGTNQVLGGLLCIASAIAFGGWFIVQTKMSVNYPCFYSCSTLITFSALIQSSILALIMNHNLEDWKLGWNIRLLSVSYTGITFGATTVITTWCVHSRGPLFVSVFGPLMLIIAAVASSLLFDEKLHVGSVIGGVVIVAGLYMVLWGKMKETKAINRLNPVAAEDDQELKPTKIENEEIASEIDNEKKDIEALHIELDIRSPGQVIQRVT